MSIWSASNGYTGQVYRETKRKIDADINELSVYPSENHVSCAIPWVPASDVKNYQEYNQRLFAHWEKCIWMKVNPLIDRNIPGAMESYTSY